MTPTKTLRQRRGAVLAVGGACAITAGLLAAPFAGAAPSADAISAINDHYSQVGAASSPLGAPVGEAVEIQGGVERDYANGAIYYSKETGPQMMYGEIFKKYRALGGPGGELGFPRNDESDTGDGVGRFNNFTEHNGETASIYWAPASGAWVIKGRVLDAWRAADGIRGPFGYPTSDTDVTADGTLTSNFVGPEGTQISWSKAGVLSTLPAVLAATIKLTSLSPSMTSPSITPPSMEMPSVAEPQAPAVKKKSSFSWWWLAIPVLLALLLPLLLKLFRKSEPAPVVTRAAEVNRVVNTPPAPVKKVVATPPPRPAATPPVAAPDPNRIERFAREAEQAARKAEHKVEHKVDTAIQKVVHKVDEGPKAAIREAHLERETKPVVHYEGNAPAETSIEVTYENNAIGANQESRADKSDLNPGHLQE